MMQMRDQYKASVQDEAQKQGMMYRDESTQITTLCTEIKHMGRSWELDGKDDNAKKVWECTNGIFETNMPLVASSHRHFKMEHDLMVHRKIMYPPSKTAVDESYVARDAESAIDWTHRTGGYVGKLYTIAKGEVRKLIHRRAKLTHGNIVTSKKEKGGRRLVRHRAGIWNPEYKRKSEGKPVVQGEEQSQPQKKKQNTGRKVVITPPPKICPESGTEDDERDANDAAHQLRLLNELMSENTALKEAASSTASQEQIVDINHVNKKQEDALKRIGNNPAYFKKLNKATEDRMKVLQQEHNKVLVELAALKVAQALRTSGKSTTTGQNRGSKTKSKAKTKRNKSKSPKNNHSQDEWDSSLEEEEEGEEEEEEDDLMNAKKSSTRKNTGDQLAKSNKTTSGLELDEWSLFDIDTTQDKIEANTCVSYCGERISRTSALLMTSACNFLKKEWRIEGDNVGADNDVSCFGKRKKVLRLF